MYKTVTVDVEVDVIDVLDSLTKEDIEKYFDMDTKIDFLNKEEKRLLFDILDNQPNTWQVRRLKEKLSALLS